jgi:hypothetical protein
MPTRRNSTPTALSSLAQSSPVKRTSVEPKGGEKVFCQDLDPAHTNTHTSIASTDQVYPAWPRS